MLVSLSEEVAPVTGLRDTPPHMLDSTRNPDRNPWRDWSARLLLPLSMAAACTSTAGANVATGGILLASLIALWPRPASALREVPRWPLSALVLVLVSHALATARTPVGELRWDVWAEESWMKLLLVAVPVLWASQRREVERAFDVLLVVASLVAVYGIVQRYTGIDLTRDRTTDPAAGRFMAEGFFQHHLSYGGNLLVTTCLALARAIPLEGHSSRARKWAVLAAVLMSIAMVFTFARSTQIGLLAGSLALVLSYRGRVRRLGFGAVTLAGLAILALPMIRERFLRVFAGGEETRWNLWRSSWDGIRAHPWTGWGQGHFGDMLRLHEVEGFYNSRSHAHNEYLMHAVNAGMVGLICQLLLVAALLVTLWRHRDRLGSSSWIVRGSFAAVVGLSTAGFFQVFQTDDEVEFLYYLTLGGALALVGSFPVERTKLPPGTVDGAPKL